MKHRKQLSVLVAALLLAVPLTLAGARGAHAQQVVLKALTAWPKPATDNQAFTFFTEAVDRLVAEKYPGELKIQYIGGPEAVKSQDQVQAVQRGMVDMVYTANAYYVSILPVVDAMKLSHMTPTEEREKGVWAYVNELHKKVGLYYLARLGLGEKFYLYLEKPIHTADLKGLNIRVSPMYLQVIKGLGGNPVNIPPTEVYAALERGVVDGFCWPAVGIRDWGWQKQVKYIVEPGFYQTPNMLLVNLDKWNKLPQKFKDLLTQAAIEAEKKTVAHFQELAKEERPILLKAGLKIDELPPAEQKKFLRVAYDEGWKSVLEKSPVAGAELKKLLTQGE